MPVLYRAVDVAELLKVSKRTLWTWVAEGKWPDPDIRRGARFRRWSLQVIQRAVRSRPKV